MTPDELLACLVALPGPPGQEDAVRAFIAERVQEMGLSARTDAKGNLLVSPVAAAETSPRIVVTAHLDEIALQVTGMRSGGELAVSPLGGAHPWKWGEGPVTIMAGSDLLPGVLSFGSIHTTSPFSAAQQARDGRPLVWDAAQVLTGLTPKELRFHKVCPGTRVVLAPERRKLFPIGGDLIGSYFLDDRADLVAWLLALETVKTMPGAEQVLFAATASEEVGGHGALYLMQNFRPDICVALEIGPSTPDAPFPVDDQPTVWAADGFAASDPRDLEIVASAAKDVGLLPHFHVVTRGGSDATCAASHGLCARPITLAFAAENSHGFEVMHRNAPVQLARLLSAVLPRFLAAA
jgi:putative aminopeptidase FrvX